MDPAEQMAKEILGHDKQGNLTESGYAMLKGMGLIKLATLDHYLSPVMNRKDRRSAKSKKRRKLLSQRRPR